MTPNRGDPAGGRPGSAPAGRAAELAAASTPSLLHLFAPGTPASAAAAAGGFGGPPADIDELATTLGRPGRAADGAAVEFTAATPAVGVDTEASRQRGSAVGPDVEQDAQPARRGHRRVTRQVVTRQVDVPAAAAPANPFTPPRTSMAVPWR